MVVEGPGNKELQENTCRSTNVVWKVQKSPCQLRKQNRVKVIMLHGLAWSEAPVLCKRKSTKVGGCCPWYSGVFPGLLSLQWIESRRSSLPQPEIDNINVTL
ncbi:uncharacterized protein [Procambarus clarkii]|uniref:uncharacterized protein isoform X2 n=1 Tax=Procambarus clarkii TaxID=6728 RepID=UPI0037434647